MTNRPDSSKGGWNTPEGAVSGRPPSEDTPNILPPTNAQPEQPGGWYVPPEANERVAALRAAAQSPAQPEAKSDLPSGAALSDQVDYSNYVPGVGFVSAEDAAKYAANAAAIAKADAGVDAGDLLDQASASPEAQVDSVPLTGLAGTENPAPAQDDEPSAVPPAADGSAAPAAATGSTGATGATGVTGSSAAQPAIDPANPAARFNDVERSVQRLRRQYTAGRMTRDQLKEELRRLMILDNDGIWWMIGLETDRWYKYNGSEWVLANPPGYTPRAETASDSGSASPSLGLPKVPGTSKSSAATGSSGSASTEGTSFGKGRYDVPLDEYGMPLPNRVPQEDDGATIVGRWASRLDSDKSAAQKRSLADGATVPSRALDVTQPSAAVSGATVPSAAVRLPAPGGVADGNTIPSALPTTQSQASVSIQPDYGPPPGGMLADRQRYGGCLLRIAILSVFLVLGGTIIGVAVATMGYFGTVSRYDAAINNLPNAIDTASQSVRIYDAANRQLFQLNDPTLGARIQTPLKNISPYLIFAIIGTENERFYSDPGFDVIALTRAVLQNLRSGGISSGASTITQQLARARVLESGAANDLSVNRKITEIIVSSEIARRYTKSQILEYYLNTVYFGNLAYGVEAASQVYFRKSAKDINLAEATLLAGLIQSPATYDPSIKRQQGEEQPAIERARTVRRLELQLGCIQMEHEPYNTGQFCVSQSDFDAAVVQFAQMEATIATFTPPANRPIYPHFVQMVREQLERDYGKDALYTSGFSVYTTIDPRIQDMAELAVKNQVSALRNLRITNGAALVIRPQDGAILAMVGSADFYNDSIQGQVNITLSARQPGSSIKPIMYLAALERDSSNNYWTPATVLWDVESCFGVSPQQYCPQNYDRKFHGPVTLRYALANSYNIPAVKTLAYIGIDRFQQVADRMGVTFPLKSLAEAGLPAALGAAEVRMIDLVSAYGTLANAGVKVDPYSISKITRRKGATEEVVFQYTPPQPRQVAEPGLTYLLSSILSDNTARTPAFGANSPLNLGFPAAVKTGTTDFNGQNRDNWTIGYTPNVVVGVWVGNADGTPMSTQATGVTGAAPIWNTIMKNLPTAYRKEFTVPPTIKQALICPDFGTLAGSNANATNCAGRRNEFYLEANPIAAPDSILKAVAVDTFTGLIANDNCKDYVENRTFLNVNDVTATAWLNNTQQGQDWAKQRNITLPISVPPTDACQAGMERPKVVLTSPQPGQQVSGLFQISGIVTMPGFNRYQIEVAQGINPTGYGIVAGPYVTQVGDPGGLLAVWDTNSRPDGQYTLRLWVVDGAGKSVQIVVPVVVNNRNPVVQPSQPVGQPTVVIPPTMAPFPTIAPTAGQVPQVPPTATPMFIDNNPFTPTPDTSGGGGGIVIFPPTPTPGP